MRHPTYKHLEARLRLGAFSLGQWAQITAAGVAAAVFGGYVSPLPTQVDDLRLDPRRRAAGRRLLRRDGPGVLGRRVRPRGAGATGASRAATSQAPASRRIGYVAAAPDPPASTTSARRSRSARRSCCGTSEPPRRRGRSRRASCAAVEAIDREGLLVTSEGALVRVLRAAPKNPLVMSRGRARAGRPRVRPARRPPAGRAVAAVLRRGAPGAPGRAARAQPAPRPSARCAGCMRRPSARRCAAAAARRAARVAGAPRRRAGRRRRRLLRRRPVPARPARRGWTGGSCCPAAPPAGDRARSSARWPRTGASRASRCT